MEKLRDLRPRIATALKESHEIIKEIPHNPVLIEPKSTSSSLDLGDLVSGLSKKKSDSKASKDDDKEDESCDSKSSSLKDTIKEIGLKAVSKEFKKKEKEADHESALETVTNAIAGLNAQSITSPEPIKGDCEESTRDMALRALRRTLIKPEGPSVEKLARKAKNQIFGGVAGSVAREMLEEDEKEAEKIAEAEVRDQEEAENQKIMKKTLDNDVEDASVTLVKQVKKADDVIKETEKEELAKVHKAKHE